MMRTFLSGAAILILAVQAMAGQVAFNVWVLDALVKVLPNTPAPAGAVGAVRIDAVRNEYESGQIVVAASSKIEKLTVMPGEVTGPDGPKPRIEARFVGFVSVKKGTQDPPPKVVAKAPVDIPDPLLASRSVGVEAGKNQPVWLTVYVPKGAEAGTYRAEVVVAGDGASASVPVEINVHPVTLPDDRTLKLTNWFSAGKFGHGGFSGTDAQWKVAEAWARMLAEYRQNVVKTGIMSLIKGRDDGKGNITWDFSRFDRWVEMFQRAGVIGYIEGGHLGGRSGGWKVKDFEARRPTVLNPDGSVQPELSVTVTSEEERVFLSKFLPALQKHLEEKGWLSIYFQHLCDEPITANAESYKKLASYVRQFAPKLRIMDACMCNEIAGSIDVWVPLTNQFDRDMKFFQDRQKAGDEVWFYTCLYPQGKYMNRFIDYPLIDVRLIHWMNFKYGATGYLHWGLCSWSGDPMKDLGAGKLPPGDSHIVYPGPRGPLSSIRFEALRDGVEDYELLKLLEKKNPKLAHEIAASVVRTPTDYTLDPGEFQRARVRIVKGLEE